MTNEVFLKNPGFPENMGATIPPTKAATATLLQKLAVSFATSLCTRVDGLLMNKSTNKSSMTPHPRLLRPRREGPADHDAEQRDEVASLHCLVPPCVPTERIAYRRLLHWIKSGLRN